MILYENKINYWINEKIFSSNLIVIKNNNNFSKRKKMILKCKKKDMIYINPDLEFYFLMTLLNI